ncbi:MAG: hypothetical protein GF387_01655 [Candidatus Portnoybacteria bacterium]|nr:hypothetical protein [Candidatus Portnoybacteria bacterium]
MDVSERDAVAYKMLKYHLKRDTCLENIPELRRKAGNIAKEVGVPTEKVMEVGLQIIEEIFVQEMEKVRSK